MSSTRKHAELLTSVRNDVSEYKASGSLSPGPSLLRERGAIHGSIFQVILSSGASSSAQQIFAVPQVLCGVVP
jgi:Golgi SNAP receptor complex protein 1